MLPRIEMLFPGRNLFSCLPVILVAMVGPAAAQHRAIFVDAAKVTGNIRSFQQVNLGPGHTRPGVVDITKQYQDLRINSVRTHDFYGPTDLDAYRPNEPWDKIIFPKWDADPEKEESYNFGPSDRLIKAIVDSGAEVYFRIGRSWNAVATPPPDNDKFASISKHVVMHYNAGWANGHRWNIRHWEVWNEPDGRFWTGTPEQFYALYDRVARTLKAYDPKLQVGTCGVAGGASESPYREGLIRYCAERKVPLDFYSWHRYHVGSYDPYDIPRIARTVRELLDSSGFRKAESHVTEWNLDAGVNMTPEWRKIYESGLNGGFVAAALIYLQDAPVELAHFYRGDAGHPLGLFRPDGSYKKTAYAYKASGMMLATPRRLAATGGDDIGFAVLAGKSADKKSVQVFITNYEIGPPAAGPAPRPPRPPRPGYINRLEPRTGVAYKDNRGYALEIRNLPWGKAGFTVKRYRVSDKDDFTLTEEAAVQGGVFKLTSELPPPAFELIVLRRK